MKNLALEAMQKQILNFVAAEHPQVYLVGGTAISLLYQHRLSEDLDFFTQDYTRKLHRKIVATVKKKTGFKYQLIEEERRKKYLPMAVYEFEIGKGLVLKIDFVKDVAELIQPPSKNGVASIEDLYYRKILTVVGWKAGESRVGKVLAGGRQKAKDLFDVYYLSAHVKLLSQWFLKYFDRNSYERLTAWYLSIPKRKMIMELPDLVPGCDTKLIFKHLDTEIIHKLNREYAGV
jgi:predicted nucleotidyltransferase component of viral defense system